MLASFILNGPKGRLPLLRWAITRRKPNKPPFQGPIESWSVVAMLALSSGLCLSQESVHIFTCSANSKTFIDRGSQRSQISGP
ncbi:hypothetical protein VN97_g9627 [Penicillium thymicola]|uniref:Uncharacterized protein n=1 Tax=Penicillium thymicola TaxID=293382 RepID=A0AAI9TBL8_PENTH|nr:hypothetical protein VN97_g9627 [Penicillium thymicola]